MILYLKYGFPVSSAEKYIKLFSTYNIPFKIVDNIIGVSKECTGKSEAFELIDYISKVEVDSLSVSEAYMKLEEIKNKALVIKGEL